MEPEAGEATDVYVPKKNIPKKKKTPTRGASLSF